MRFLWSTDPGGAGEWPNMINHKSNRPEDDGMGKAVDRSKTEAPAIPRKAEPDAIDWIERHALVSPNALAQVDLASGRRFTFAKMNERVAALRPTLKAWA